MATVVSTKRVRLAQKRRKVRVVRLFLLLVLFILAYAGITYCLTREWAGIKTVNVTGNSAVSSTKLVNSIQREMSGLRAYSLYAGTIFTYNEEAIVSSLMYKYPRLKRVELSSSSVDTLDVDVDERIAVAKWCSDVDMCYVLDQQGYIFDMVNDVSGLVEYKGGVTGVPLRKTLLSGRLSSVLEFVRLLKREDVDVTKVEILSDELLVHSTEHPILKVKLDEYLNRSVGYASATLDSVDYKAYASSGTSTPQYIDLRFGNRVYYK